MKSKRITWFVILAFCLTIVGPLLVPAPVEAAGTSEIVAELNNLYQYIDENDKADLRAARQQIPTADWDKILDDNVITSQVSTAFGDKNGAKDALKAFATDFSTIYYSADTANMESTINKFRKDHSSTFHTLFGPDVKVDNMFTLLNSTRKQVPNVITLTEAKELARCNSGELIAEMPDIMKRALAAAITDPFKGKLSAIGWSVDGVVTTKNKIATKIDSGNKAELALAKAAVRSQAQIAKKDGATIEPVGITRQDTIPLGTDVNYELSIMGYQATGLVDWAISDSTVAELKVYDPETPVESYGMPLTPKKAGDAVLIAYRAGGDSAKDWILKLNLTTYNPTPSDTSKGGSGGGGEQKGSDTVTVGGTSVDKETSTVDGKTVETFTVKEDVVKQIKEAEKKGAGTVDIRVPASNTATTVIQVPNQVLNSAEGMNVNISCRNISLELPKALVDALAKSGQDLNITIERGTASEATAALSGVKGAEGAKVLGTPTHINTAIKGNTTLTLPLEGISIPTDPAAQKAFLDSLAIIAVHGDNSKELIQGTIVYEGNKPVGIKFTVDRFSMFAIVKLADESVTPVVTLTDISGHWAQANIQKLVEAGAISGYPDKTFKPDANISRAEFAVTLVKALKLAPKDGKVFDDTADHWAKDFIATAQAYGIISGYSDTLFGPEDKITREQMAVMVVKAANLVAGENAKTFTDSDKVSAWAKDAVIAASSNAVISGYPDGSFKPQANATRAEAVTVIVKILK